MLALASSSCTALLAPDPSPSYSASAGYATAYWFRGTPIHERGVYQGYLTASANTADGGTLSGGTWVNMDGSNDPGDAINPRGNGGKFTEIDLWVGYSRSIGPVSTSVGISNYNFPNGVGGSTTEAYLALSTQALGFSQSASFYYDFDEIEGWYGNLAASRSLTLAEDLSLSLGLSLGLIEADQAAVYFGASESGISDLNASATLTYALDEYSSIFVSVTGVRPLDSDLEDALELAGLSDDGVWAMVGTSWQL